MNLNALMQVATMYDGFTETSLWDGIELDERVDKSVLIFEIIKECGHLEPLVNTVGGFVQLSNSFFRKWKYQIGKLLDTQEFDYNPIWNKDGTIKEIRNLERDRNRKMEDDYSENVNTNRSGSEENTVSAFDSSSYQPHDKSTFDNDENQNTGANRDIDEKETESEGENTTRIEQGNIGVTTTQTMITEERELYNFNIYDWIVTRYADELFIPYWD